MVIKTSLKFLPIYLRTPTSMTCNPVLSMKIDLRFIESSKTPINRKRREPKVNPKRGTKKTILTKLLIFCITVIVIFRLKMKSKALGDCRIQKNLTTPTQ